MNFAKKEDKSKKVDKKEKEKEQVHQQFEGQDLDSIKKEFDEKLAGCVDILEEDLKNVKSGRASPNIFDHIEVNAYHEKHPFSDLCQTIVKGSNLLMVKIFDENVKEDVLKALQRSEFDLNCTMEGKDIKVKLGTTKKEHIDAALKQLKNMHDDFKKNIKEVRHEMNTVLKKLDLILPKDEIKILQKDLEKLITNNESDAKKHIDAKEREIKTG